MMAKIIMAGLFFGWPWFHHKGQTARTTSHNNEPTVQTPDPDRLGCDKDEDTYYFVGPDGMIGMSKVSCSAAYELWKHEPSAAVPTGLI